MRQIPSDWANERGGQTVKTENSWLLLVRTAAFRRATELPDNDLAVWLDQNAKLVQGEADDPQAQLIWRGAGRFDPGPALASEQHDFVRLYLPLLAARADQPVVVAHLGQSIDAMIATDDGDSYYVTGHENLRHLHRMRALCDAIIVGAGTVSADNPSLTTRLVEGPNPVRVVIDPERRLEANRYVFNDGKAETVRVGLRPILTGTEFAHQELTVTPTPDGQMALDGLVQALGARGLQALFVEGGGITVSRWMNAGLLDRLQIATAPLLVGPGRPALTLPSALNMQACLRPEYRLYQMGEDILWDLDLRASRAPDCKQAVGLRRLA